MSSIDVALTNQKLSEIDKELIENLLESFRKQEVPRQFFRLVMKEAKNIFELQKSFTNVLVPENGKITFVGKNNINSHDFFQIILKMDHRQQKIYTFWIPFFQIQIMIQSIPVLFCAPWLLLIIRLFSSSVVFLDLPTWRKT